jgi:hypothetical protein
VTGVQTCALPISGVSTGEAATGASAVPKKLPVGAVKKLVVLEASAADASSVGASTSSVAEVSLPKKLPDVLDSSGTLLVLSTELKVNKLDNPCPALANDARMSGGGGSSLVNSLLSHMSGNKKVFNKYAPPPTHIPKPDAYIIIFGESVLYIIN